MTPWFERVRRYGQTNLTERDARDFDFDFWRTYWRETQIGGVIVNAGGVVAFYPSKFPLHNRARFLGERDLFGEISVAAREENLKAASSQMWFWRQDIFNVMESPP